MINPPNNDDTPIPAEVKGKLLAGTQNKHEFKIRLQGMLLWAFEDYCNKRSLTMEQGLRNLLEMELVRVRELPEWWFERIGKH